uniref:Uncharacterized protein n=1 Tax=Peronospora matthiolae TaxID=2874970 RepID=A0AAV1TJF4_9STRA
MEISGATRVTPWTAASHFKAAMRKYEGGLRMKAQQAAGRSTAYDMH